ncbi:Dihydropyrimidinase-like protein [Drosera capensis]
MNQCYQSSAQPSPSISDPLLDSEALFVAHTHRPSHHHTKDQTQPRRRHCRIDLGMESRLGFVEPSIAAAEQSPGYKLVPWLSWDEWDSVRVALFSDSPDSVFFALRRISAWRSRGCLPVVVEVTASIIEIQQKDPHFRVDLGDEAVESEEILAMLYSMAITRIVNGMIEKTRKQTEMSIADAAEVINMPRMLIDIRHEGSHRELPSVRLLRLASVKALNWLKSYYWDAQVEAIPLRRGKGKKLRKEIKSRFHEVAACLKAKKNPESSSLQIKGKGFKKQVRQALKNLVRLYSYFSSEVVSVQLGLLLKVSNLVLLMESPEASLANLSLDTLQSAFDEWKPVIIKLSKKEPELLLNLLTTVMDMICSREGLQNEGEHPSVSEYDAEDHKIELLSSLFSWLLDIVMGIDKKCEGCSAIPRATLVGLLRRCLLISRPGSEQILRSALLLTQMIGNSLIPEKLSKLSAVFSSVACPDGPIATTHEDLLQQEKHIHRAAQKLKSFELGRMKRESYLKPCENSKETITSGWTITESWNPCPIGMLSRAVGSSGRLPTLDCSDLSSKDPDSIERHGTNLDLVDRKNDWELMRCGKRGASCDTEHEQLEISSVKRMKETLDAGELDDKDATISPGNPEIITETYQACEPDNDVDSVISYDGTKGRLLIGGVLRKVGEEELQEIKRGQSLTDRGKEAAKISCFEKACTAYFSFVFFCMSLFVKLPHIEAMIYLVRRQGMSMRRPNVGATGGVAPVGLRRLIKTIILATGYRIHDLCDFGGHRFCNDALVLQTEPELCEASWTYRLLDLVEMKVKFLNLLAYRNWIFCNKIFPSHGTGTVVNCRYPILTLTSPPSPAADRSPPPSIAEMQCVRPQPLQQLHCATSPFHHHRPRPPSCAKIFNIYPREGAILAGSDADIIILNPNASFEISEATHHSRSDNNIYEGFTGKGKVEVTIAGGRIVWENEELKVVLRSGKYIEMPPYSYPFGGIDKADARYLSSLKAPIISRYVTTMVTSLSVKLNDDFQQGSWVYAVCNAPAMIQLKQLAAGILHQENSAPRNSIVTT